MLIPVSRLEPGFQRRLVVRAVAGDLARGEVHLAVRSGMDAAQIQHQHAVHEQPEIVVAGEFEHDVVAPIVLTAGRLREVGFQLHAEMEVDAALLPGGVRDAVEFLPIPGIHGVQGVAVNVVQVGLIFADIGRIQIVVGIELSVPQRFGSVLTFVHGAQLIVYLEGPVVIQIGIVLGAVELVISTLVIGLLNEEMVDLIGTAEQLTQRFAVACHNGVSVRPYIGLEQIQPRIGTGHTLAAVAHDIGLQMVAPTVIANGIQVVKVDHLHGDAVLDMIDRFHLGELARGRTGDGEVPVVRQGAGDDLQLFRLKVHTQTVVGTLAFIPADDLGVVITIPATGQAQIIPGPFAAGQEGRFLREDMHLFAAVVQAAVIPVIGKALLHIPVREEPLHGLVLRAVPEDLAAGVVAFDQATVGVDGIELIPLEGIVPHAGVYDVCLCIHCISGRDLLGGENTEIRVFEGRIVFGQIKPGVGAGGRTTVEAVIDLAVAVVHIYVVADELELDHAGIVARAGGHQDQAGVFFIRCASRRLFVHQDQLSVLAVAARRGLVASMAQILSRRSLQIILETVPRPFEGPFVDRVVGHQEEVIEEVHVLHLAVDRLRGSLSGIRGVVVRHQRRAGSGGVGRAHFVVIGVIANDAVAFAVQAEGILLRRSIVFKLQLCVVVGFAPPRRKPFAAGVSRLVPAPGGGPADVLRHEHAERDVLCVVWFHIESSGLP